MTDEFQELREQFRRSAACRTCDGSGSVGYANSFDRSVCDVCCGSGGRAFDLAAFDAVLDHLFARIEALEKRT